MPFRLARSVIAAPILASIALLPPASAQVSAAGGRAAGPSEFDYVVLASFVDASNLLAMSVYRAPSRAAQQSRAD